MHHTGMLCRGLMVFSVKTVVQLASRGLNFIGQVKQCHKNFPKKYLEDLMERMSPGNWIVMHSVEPMVPVKGAKESPDALVNILVTGYKYNYKKYVPLS